MGNERQYESEKIFQAAKILKLSETATLEEIKKQYRHLIKKWHPDNCQAKPDECQDKTEKITQAYKIILKYCNNYRYSFKKEEINEHLPVEKRLQERLREQFGDMSY